MAAVVIASGGYAVHQTADAIHTAPTVVVLCLNFLLMIGLIWWQKVWFPHSNVLPCRDYGSSSKCLTRLRVATLFVTSRLRRRERLLPMRFSV